MKKVILFTSVIAFFTACQNNSQKESTVNDTTMQDVQSIGGSKDKHGCLTGAGQTWSQIKNECIQVFSVGIRLNPVQVDSSQAIISAFVVPNADNTAYELFLADIPETVILSKATANQFSKDGYTYKQDSGELFINNTLAYQLEK